MGYFDDFIKVEHEYYNEHILSAKINLERKNAKLYAANELKKMGNNLETLIMCSIAKNDVTFNTSDTSLLKQFMREIEVNELERLLSSATGAAPGTAPGTAPGADPAATIPEHDLFDVQIYIETLLLIYIVDPKSVHELADDEGAFNAIKNKIKELRENIEGLDIAVTTSVKDGGGSPLSLKERISGGDRDSIKTLTKLCMFLILIWFIHDDSKMRLMIEGYYMIRKGYCFTFKEAMWSAIGLDNPVCTQYRIFVMSIFNLTIFDYLKYCFTGSSVAVLVSQLNSLMNVVLDRGLNLIGYNENPYFNENTNVHRLLPDTSTNNSGGGFPKLSRKISKTKKIRKKRKKGYKKTKNKKKRKSRLI